MTDIFLTALTVPESNPSLYTGAVCAINSYLRSNMRDGDPTEMHILLGSRGEHSSELHNRLMGFHQDNIGSVKCRVFDCCEYNFASPNDPGNVTRHAAMARHIRENIIEPKRQHRVMTFDARDTLFHSNPFTAMAASRHRPTLDYGCVHVFCEGFRYSEDGWNRADLSRLADLIPDATAHTSDGLDESNFVINGGFVLGSAAAVAEFSALRYMFGLPFCRNKSNGTDQAQLGYLAHTATEELGLHLVRVSPKSTFAVIHGHGIWARPEGAALPSNDRIVYDPVENWFKGENSGTQVCVMHQWDRNPDPKVTAAFQQQFTQP